jgi:hypothetical protein
VLSRYMSLLDQRNGLRERGFAGIRKGLANMSDAQFECMTPLDLTQNSYEGRAMTASLRVQDQADDTDKAGAQLLSLVLSSNNSSQGDDEDFVWVGEDVKDEASSLRRRRVGDAAVSATNASKASAEEDVDFEEPIKSSCPPLQWFGALVPPALRDAEAAFSTSLGALVEMVNADRQLAVLEADFALLKSRKQSLPIKST